MKGLLNSRGIAHVNNAGALYLEYSVTCRMILQVLGIFSRLVYGLLGILTPRFVCLASILLTEALSKVDSYYER